MVVVEIEVLDFITRKPVANAEVIIDKYVLKTNEDGKVTVELEPNLYWVVVRHPNYYEQSQAVDVRLAQKFKIYLMPKVVLVK